MGSEITISTGYGKVGFGNVAFDGNNFLIVWTDDDNDYEVKGRFVSPTGSLGTEFTINASTYPSDNPLTVAFDGTNYLVVWDDEVGGYGSGVWDLFGQLVDTSGNLVGGVITVSAATGHQILPLIAFDGTNYLVTWTDMRNDANYDWVCDSGEGTCWDIYGQFISKSGALIGSEFTVNTDSDNQLGGVAGFNGGKYFVIVNTGVTVTPEEGEEGVMGGDVYGVFVSPSVCQCPVDSTPPTDCISGQVTDRAGRPLAGKTVVLEVRTVVRVCIETGRPNKPPIIRCRNRTIRQTERTQTDSSGCYQLEPPLPPEEDEDVRVIGRSGRIWVAGCRGGGRKSLPGISGHRNVNFVCR